MVGPTPSAPAGGRRDRHKKATWDRLYTAAVELFTEQGYDETPIEAITERADVARGTFFNYFDKKEDVIAAWGENRRESLRSGLRDIVEGGRDVATCLENCMRKLAKINEEEWRTTRVMLPAWVRAGHPIYEEPYAATLFAEIIQTGQERGDACVAMDPILAGNMLRELYLGTLYRYVGARIDPASLEDELIASLRIILVGLVRVDSPLRESL
jgi:TetR/AcrR family transcriptional regulator, cholesterol catabolism regulator